MMWDWFLASAGIFGLYLMTKKKAEGFAVGLILQIFWLIYAISTEQYGFIMSALGFGFMNAWGLYRWTRPETTVDGE